MSWFQKNTAVVTANIARILHVGRSLTMNLLGLAPPLVLHALPVKSEVKYYRTSTDVPPLTHTVMQSSHKHAIYPSINH